MGLGKGLNQLEVEEASREVFGREERGVVGIFAPGTGKGSTKKILRNSLG